MKLNSLFLANFRNYSYCNLSLPASINVFYGANAQGKTNLLEAIYYGAFAMSHRTSKEEEMLLLGKSEMAVGLCYESQDYEHELKVKRFSLENTVKKELWLDGKKVKPKEHYGSFSAVMFSPEDLQLIKGDPALRRKYFNMQIAQTNPVYYDLLVRYNRVLQQRNKLLKNIRENLASEQALLPWNEEFLALAAQITKIRLAALAKLQPIAGEIYSSITSHQENLELQYELKGNNGELLYLKSEDLNLEDFYRQRLKARQQVDIWRGNTGIGPHRDDLLLLLQGRPIKSFGSQGQQRTGALALKLSQLEYVYQEIGEYPVLLLDDVMSELDGNRRAQLLCFIDGKIQTFVTVNDKSLIPELANNAYFEIQQGIIKEG